MSQPPPGLSAAEFEEIESAVKETERGRWFLDEFERRRRAEETTRILAAIERLAARSAEAEAAETRARLESERCATALRELANLLREPRPSGDGRPLPPPLARIAASPPADNSANELEARFAALANFEALDVENKLKRLG